MNSASLLRPSRSRVLVHPAGLLSYARVGAAKVGRPSRHFLSRDGMAPSRLIVLADRPSRRPEAEGWCASGDCSSFDELALLRRPASSAASGRLAIRLTWVLRMTGSTCGALSAGSGVRNTFGLPSFHDARAIDTNSRRLPGSNIGALDQRASSKNSLLPSRPARFFPSESTYRSKHVEPIWIPSRDHQEVPRIQPALHQLLQHALRVDRLTAHRRAQTVRPSHRGRGAHPRHQDLEHPIRHGARSPHRCVRRHLDLVPSPAPRRLSRPLHDLPVRQVNHTTLGHTTPCRLPLVTDLPASRCHTLGAHLQHRFDRPRPITWIFVDRDLRLSTSSSIGSRNCPSRFRNSLIARLSARSLTSYVPSSWWLRVGVFAYPSLSARDPRATTFLSPLSALQLRCRGTASLHQPRPVFPRPHAIGLPRLCVKCRITNPIRSLPG